MISLIMWHPKYDTNELIQERETDSQTVGVWRYQMQAVWYRMDKRQDTTIQHRELHPMSYD